MDSSIATYIANEEAKIKALRDEADSRSRNLEAFKAAYQNMQGPDVIDLNARVRPTQAPVMPANPFAISAGSGVQPAASQAEQSPADGRETRRKGQVKYVVLKALTREPQRLKDLVDVIHRSGHKLSYNHIRTELWSMKGAGLTLSPETGAYQITAKGEAALQAVEGESPVAAGLSGATTSVGDDLA